MQETKYEENGHQKMLQEVFHGEDADTQMDNRLGELESEGHSLSRRMEIS